MNHINADQLLNICIAFSKEKDYDMLLETILSEAMSITRCDAGTLYIYEENLLHFKIRITKSLKTNDSGKKSITLPPVALTRDNVCAYCAMDKRIINIEDVYNSEKFDFSGPRRYDSITGYKTTSMLVVPMKNDHDEIIGILQLINALDNTGCIIPFDESYELFILSLGAQAAICLTNMNYAKENIMLLKLFVRVMSTAIDERSPYNASHTKNMVLYAGKFVDWLNKTCNMWRFTEAEKEQLLMTIWLHDVGKLVIPLEIMDKESRLADKLNDVLHRLEIIELLENINYLKKKVSEKEYRNKLLEVHNARNVIKTANKSSYLNEDIVNQIEEISKKIFVDSEGIERKWLTEDESYSLRVRRGTLTKEERQIMENHVVMTNKILSQMRFTRNYKKVPEWAGLHHEFLNGEGYPNSFQANDIPKEVRLITILDVFDALTARDRPYRLPMSIDRAFDVLGSMVEEGKLDGDIVRIFKSSRAWEISKLIEEKTK